MSNSKKKEPVNLDFGDLAGGVENQGGQSNQETKKNEGFFTKMKNALKGEKVDKPEENNHVTPEQEEDQKSQSEASSHPIDYEDVINIPVKNKDGSYTLKLIEEVSGEEFLAWVDNVYPVPPKRRPKADKYDGPDNLAKRKKALKTIEHFWTNTLKRTLEQRKDPDTGEPIQFDKLIH